MAPKAKPDFYSPAQAAKVLGLKPARVRQMCVDGTVSAFKVGSIWVISAAAVEAAKGRKTAPGPARKEAA